MSGNDFADFFPLDPNFAAGVDDPTFPDVFKSSGAHEEAPEFISLTPQIYKNVATNRAATEFNGLTPSVFKYSLAISGGGGGGGGGPVTGSYRMRGYDPALSAYEFWITTDPTSPVPPSLNVLTNVVVESVLE